MTETTAPDALTFVYLRDRTVRHLDALPLLAVAMVANARPVDPVRSTSKPGPRYLPVLSGLALLDEVWDFLGHWVTNIARHLGTPPPGTLMVAAIRDVPPDRLPASIPATFRVARVSEVVGWLKTRQNAIQRLPFARDWDSDLDSNMRAWLSRYPIEIDEQVAPHMCEWCGRGKLTVTWSDDPEHYDDYRVDCVACGRKFAAVGVMAQDGGGSGDSGQVQDQNGDLT